ncbi:flagellar biosynthesis protein FlgJ [Marinomonas sp. M1K-6]|uniref:Flagellar biosynthesis protein FlgJ n=1 Tax=Marinomonas profundi TaxID=2726122 RepID=A0A847R3G0_9GAMM|nr:glucosaminidase domain-containing protein [Marinomonas profundi]NLQ16486.1 flagellar biosynthesis protein FlgJ [Marinomonas profundi]UDV03924.1 glucosaminidase domain-containing protein [Marinomonas profundi]
MEKKILWIISFALIFILWMKVGPFQNGQDDTSSSYQESEGATSDEKNYFKSHPIKTKTPDFAAITDIQARKNAFFNYLTPFVNEKNDLILKDRARLNKFLDKGLKLSSKDKKWLSTLRKDNKLQVLESYEEQDIKALLNRLDIIPVSLVLAQSANESAWGTSRFATEGNNFFGQWCFRKGCGLVPESRDSDADHEVRKFHDARESVFAYIDNINTNAAYKELRAARLELRQSNEEITGLALVHGLQRYSERGQAYVEEIEGLINYNKLWRYNQPQAAKEPE